MASLGERHTISKETYEKIGFYRRQGRKVMLYIQNPQWSELGHRCPSMYRTWNLGLVYDNGRYIYDDNLIEYVDTENIQGQVHDDDFAMYCYVKTQKGYSSITAK